MPPPLPRLLLLDICVFPTLCCAQLSFLFHRLSVNGCADAKKGRTHDGYDAAWLVGFLFSENRRKTGLGEVSAALFSSMLVVRFCACPCFVCPPRLALGCVSGRAASAAKQTRMTVSLIILQQMYGCVGTRVWGNEKKRPSRADAPQQRLFPCANYLILPVAPCMYDVGTRGGRNRA